MEIWKTMDDMDGVFSISNTRKIHQAEYSTMSNCLGKEFSVRVPEKYYKENNGTITVEYKKRHIMFVVNEELEKYFNKDEINEGKKLEAEFAMEVDSRGIANCIPKDVKVASLDGENWVNIKNFKGYEVSDAGRIKHLSNWNQNGNFYPEYIVKPTLNEYGKLSVKLWLYPLGHIEKEVAMLVAENFLSNPKHYMCVKHLNGDELDNRLENLQWYDNTPNCYYECTQTGEKYTLTDACVKFNMSPEEFLFDVKFGMEIKGHVFVEKKMKIHSSNGNVGKCIIAKDATREPVKMVRKYVKKVNTITNPNNAGKTFVPPTSEVSLKNSTIIDSFKIADKPQRETGERVKDIPEFKDYLVSSTGVIKRKANFVNGVLQKEYNEIPFERDGLMWVKLINSDGVQEKLVERIVAKAFLYNPQDLYKIVYKDNDYKNLNVDNLSFSKETVRLKDSIQIDELAEKVNKSRFDIYTSVLEGKEIEGEKYMIVKDFMNNRSYAILCKETQKVFPTICAAAEEYGLKQPSISCAIKAGRSLKGYTFVKIPNTDRVSKEIPNYPNYRAYEDGTIVKIVNGKEVIVQPKERGGSCRLYVNLVDANGNNRQYSVAYFIASAFIERPINAYTITFKDGNEKNASASNLKWVTTNSANLLPQMKNAQPVRCVETNKIYNSLTDASKDFNTSASQMRYLVNFNKKYKDKYTFEYVSKENIPSEQIKANYVYCVEQDKTYYSIAAFVKENNLVYSAVYNAFKNKKSYKGLTLIKATDKISNIDDEWELVKDGVLINKDGIIRILARTGANGRSYSERIIKPKTKNTGERVSQFFYKGAYMNLDVDKIVKEKFYNKVEEYKKIDKPATDVLNKYEQAAKDAVASLSEKLVPETVNEPVKENAGDIFKTHKKSTTAIGDLYSAIHKLDDFYIKYENYFGEVIKSELTEILNNLTEKTQNAEDYIISDKDYSILNRFKELAREV